MTIANKEFIVYSVSSLRYNPAGCTRRGRRPTPSGRIPSQIAESPPLHTGVSYCASRVPTAYILTHFTLFNIFNKAEGRRRQPRASRFTRCVHTSLEPAKSKGLVIAPS
ncbi:hypothetical protein ACJJTC_007021 [Scirpophaga incertulas]